MKSDNKRLREAGEAPASERHTSLKRVLEKLVKLEAAASEACSQIEDALSAIRDEIKHLEAEVEDVATSDVDSLLESLRTTNNTENNT